MGLVLLILTKLMEKCFVKIKLYRQIIHKYMSCSYVGAYNHHYHHTPNT
jgi:hypothetical protein